eukprot:9779505-Alexandrium_andersonii.AAC.1
MVAFLNGQRELHELHSLVAEMSKARFAITIEWYAEALHAETHRITLGARHHGPAFVALNQSLPEIEARLDRDAGFLPELAANCARARQPVSAAIAL